MTIQAWAGKQRDWMSDNTVSINNNMELFPHRFPFASIPMRILELHYVRRWNSRIDNDKCTSRTTVVGVKSTAIFYEVI